MASNDQLKDFRLLLEAASELPVYMIPKESRSRITITGSKPQRRLARNPSPEAFFADPTPMGQVRVTASQGTTAAALACELNSNYAEAVNIRAIRLELTLQDLTNPLAGATCTVLGRRARTALVQPKSSAGIQPYATQAPYTISSTTPGVLEDPSAFQYGYDTQNNFRFNMANDGGIVTLFIHAANQNDESNECIPDPFFVLYNDGITSTYQTNQPIFFGFAGLPVGAAFTVSADAVIPGTDAFDAYLRALAHEVEAPQILR